MFRFLFSKSMEMHHYGGSIHTDYLHCSWWLLPPKCLHSLHQCYFQKNSTYQHDKHNLKIRINSKFVFVIRMFKRKSKRCYFYQSFNYLKNFCTHCQKRRNIHEIFHSRDPEYILKNKKYQCEFQSLYAILKLWNWCFKLQ